MLAQLMGIKDAINSARVSLSTLEGSEEDVRKLLGDQSTSQVTNVNLRNQDNLKGPAMKATLTI